MIIQITLTQASSNRLVTALQQLIKWGPFDTQIISRSNFVRSSNEVLTIRQYLDLHEDCLHLFGFTDPWKAQKQLENDFAIARLSDRLQEIDKLEADERWTEICRGMLAG